MSDRNQPSHPADDDEFLDDDGTAYLSYWMLWGDKGIGLAKSTDPHYDRWKKFESNPVIKSTEWGITETKDQDGKPMADRPYKLRLATGEIREGTTDGDGHAEEDDIPPGGARLSYKIRQ